MLKSPRSPRLSRSPLISLISRLRGRRISLITQISLIVLLIFLPLALLGLWLGREKAIASWYDDSWGYRNSIAITSHTAAESNVYISATIDTSASGQFQSDCGDLRFTDYAGNLLPYYISSGCGTATTVIHVFFQSFPAGAQTIYYYYGNPSADNGFSAADFATEATGYVIGTTGSQEKGGGPVGWWKFDDGTGTNAQDSSPNNNDGTITGATWQTEDMCVSGKCLKFDGSGDYVDAGSRTSLDFGTGDFSLAAWIKTTQTSEGQVISRGTGGNANSAVFRVTGAGKINFTISTANQATSTVSVNDSKWHYVAVSADRDGNAVLYVDGKQETSVSISSASANGITSSRWNIGSEVFIQNYFNGFIDDIKIYNYARTAAQIKSDFKSRGTQKGVSAQLAPNSSQLSSGLVGYWKMDEASANGCTGGVNDSCDASGNGNDGAWTGDATSAAGKFGNAVTFDGTGDYIGLGSTIISTWSELSWGFWFKADTTSANDGLIGETTNSANGFFTYIIDNTIRTNIKTASGSLSSPYLSASFSDTSGWHYYAITYKSGDFRAYLDGAQVARDTTLTGNLVSPSNNLSIGSYWSPAGTFTFDGSVDDLRIYNRALSPREVRDLYNWAPGPVGYWNFEEGNGQSANDTSGNSNTGTLGASSSVSSDDPSWTSGKFGGGTLLDGSNDIVRVGTSSILAPRNAMTVSFWFKPLTLAATPTIMGKADSNDGWKVFLTTNTICFFGRISNPSYDFKCSTSTLSTNNWYYFTATFDQGAVKIYLNGTLDTSKTFSITYITDPTTVNFDMGFLSNWVGYYNGYLDDVKIYSYSRTQKQIVEDMQAGSPSASSGSQVGYWKFDEGQGTVANNAGSGGSALNGTLTQMASPATATSGWTNSGKFGKAVTFDGSNDYITLGDSDTFSFDDGTTDRPFSVSAWINTNSTGAQGIVTKYGDFATTKKEWSFGLDASNFVQFHVQDDSAQAFRGRKYSTALSTGTWYHVVATYDGGGQTGSTQIFLNGKRVDDTNQTTGTYTAMENGTAPVAIGIARVADLSSPFNGKIDEVKIYNYALTSDEIKLDYNQGTALSLGSLSTDPSSPSTPSNSSASAYCVPGDSSACTAPVGEWNFEEGSGASAYDSSGNGNTGTLTSGPTWTNGKIGKGLNFDGTDGKMIETSKALSNFITNSEGTVEVWMKPVGSAVSSAAIYQLPAVVADTCCAGGYFGIFRGNYTGVGDGIYVFNYDGSVDYVRIASYNVNEWVHITWVHSGGMLYAYKNGILIGSTASGNTGALTFNLRIGDNGTSSPFTGQVDQVRTFNYARTAAQVAWDYNRGGPVGHWKMNECEGTTANDSSGNGNAGTITIGATGTQASLGTCAVSAATAWFNGATGKYNSSLNFDGTDDYVTVANTSSINSAGTTGTVSAWVNLDSVPGGSNIATIVDIDDTGCTNRGLFLYIQGSSYKFQYGSGGVCQNATATTAASTGTWTHVVAAWGSSGGRIYINGKQEGSDADIPDVSIAQANTIIGSHGGTLRFVNGQIDDARVYNYALTATQIKTLFNENSSVRFGPQTGSP